MFRDLPTEEQEWLQCYLDGTLDEASFELLQDRMAGDPALRAAARNLLSLDSFLHEKSIASGEDPLSLAWGEEPPAKEPRKISRFPSFVPIAAAALIAFLVSLAAVTLFDRNAQQEATSEMVSLTSEGFAVVESVFDAEWPAGSLPRRDGDILSSEVFELARGTAEIRFFSGAVMTVDGPAEIAIKSAWEASCMEGAIRMRVPPAARGFKLQAPDSEIIDLGTEFGLHVKGGEAYVEVFDGEISLQHSGEDALLLTKGTARGMPENKPSLAASTGTFTFPEIGTLDSRANERLRDGFDRWKNHRDALAIRDDIIAYYTFDQQLPSSLVPNLTLPPNAELDGAAILAESVNGRWPGLKSAYEFPRPGSRIRVSIPGEFPAFTFFTWVRIDSLDRLYNALFMGDGYETGEPHWQIRNDGKMMLSIMVDHTRPDPSNKNKEMLHTIYLSPPMWDISKSGQWINLASVYDPANKRVSHYVDGQRISQAPIKPLYQIDTLRIGNAEIGNWGQPFRETPSFAIRNLNGRVDEIAIFRAALDDTEIAALHQASRAGKH